MQAVFAAKPVDLIERNFSETLYKHIEDFLVNQQDFYVRLVNDTNRPFQRSFAFR